MSSSPDTNTQKNIPLREAASHSGYSTGYLSYLCRTGKVIGKYSHNEWAVDKTSLEVFIKGQAERKEARARALAHAREEEYQRAQRPSKARESRGTKIENRKPILHSPFSTSSTLRSQAVALATAFLVVGTGALAAQASFIPQLAEKAAALAHEVALGFGDRFGDVPSRIAENVSAADSAMGARIADVAVANEISTAPIEPLNFSSAFAQLPAFENASGQLRGEASRLAKVSTAPATEAVVTIENLKSFGSALYENLASPSLAVSTLAHAYTAIGAGAYADIVASLDGYRALVERSGADALALGATTRDTLATAPRFVNDMNLAFGTAVIGASHALIGADVSLAYRTADAAPASARTTVALIGGAGDLLAGATARVPALATTAYLRATAAPAVLAPALASAVFDSEYAMANRFVPVALDISGRYLALVKDTGDVAYAGTTGALALANATGPALAHLAGVPAALQNTYLGALGKSSLAFGTLARVPNVAAVLSAAAPTLNAGEQFALATYETIRGLVSSTTSALAMLFGSSSPAVIPTRPVVALATSTPVSSPNSQFVIHNSASSSPLSNFHSPTSTAPTAPSYPTYVTNLNGVSVNDVKQLLAAQRSDILATVAGQLQPIIVQGATNQTTIQQVNMIQNLSDLVNVGATTASFGSLTAGGASVTGGVLVNGGIVSNTSATAPFFAATSAAATSTFAGAVGIGTTTPQGNLDVAGTSHFRSDTYLSGFIDFNRSQLEGSLDTSVAIAARTPAGLTGVNASGYNAIWTLPSSGTVGTASFNGWYSRTDVPAVAATYQQLTNMYVGPTQIGAAATINNWTGLYVADQTINGSGLTKALDLGIGSGTGKFNIYAAGTAPNYFAGNVGIGTTSPYAQLSIATPNGSTGSLSTLFTISSSTQQGATSTLVSVFANGSVAFGSLPKNGGVSLSGSSYPYGIYDQNDSNSALTFSNQTAALGATANLNFNISGSQKMTINSSGSVGIGTTSPWGQLSVNPNGITGPSFVIGSSTATNFIVTNGGLVGIGTANPQRALEIDSTGTGGSTIRLGRQTSSSYSSVDYYPTYNASPSVSAPSWSSGYYGSAGNNGYSIWSFDNSSNAIRFYIDPTGSVGIGTTSPAQTFSVAGNGYFTGGLGVGVATTTPGVFQTSGDAKIGGNLTVVGNSTTLGQSSANTLVVNASVSSDIIPTINGSYSLGSSSFYWKNLYVGTLTANSVSAASTTIGGTQSKTFTLDSANATADADNQSLIFMRGSVVPNALLTWNSAGAAKRFEFNQPLFIQDASASTTNTTFTLQSVAGQTGDIFHVASSSSATTLFNITGNGNVGVGTVSPITQFSNTATILADSNGIQVGPGGITWIAPAAGPTYAAAISQSGASAGNRNALLIKTAATDNGSYILRAEGGGGPAFVATAAGNVGIGTTSPYAKLSIQGAGTGTGANLVTTNSNQKPLLMVLDNGNAGLAYNGGFGGGPGYLPAVNTLPQAQFQIATPDLSDGGATVNWAEVISTYYGGGTGADSGGGVGILFSHTGNTGASSRSAGISSVSEGAYSQNVGLGFYTTSGYSGTPTERMRITGAGNVGIGTTNPGQKLEVNGYSQFDNTGTDGGYTRIGEIDNHRGIYTNGGPFAIAVGGGGSIILNGTPTNNTGNVGIGTTSPRSYEFAGSKVLDLTGSAITTLSLHGGGTAQEANVVTDGTGLYLDITGSATASNNGIHFRTSNVNSDYNAFEKMTILSSGNVGIGTTTPTSKLFVYDASGGATVANFQTPGGGLVQFTNGYIQSNSGLFDLWGTAASGTRIGAGNAEAMRILANGNVGIGTTTPWGRLSVTGAGTGTGVGFIVADSNNAQNFKILDNGNVNIGNSATINAGKVVIQTSSAPGTSDGTLSPLRLEYAGGDVSGTIGAGVAFSQRYDSVDTSQIRVGAIYGYKEQPSGGFGGGLAFYTQPAGAGNMTERMRINMTGNIGIGLTTPIDSVLTINANSGNASTIGGISLLGTNTNYGARMTVFDTGTGIQEQFILKAAGVYDPIPAMVIGGAGNTRNVGIGTTSPQWPLDVYKSDSNSMRLDSLTGNETFILSRGAVSKALFGIAASANQIIPGSATDDFAIRSGQRILFSADGGTTGHMVIQNNGNVGIGSTTPNAPLVVSNINTNLIADFVGNGVSYIRVSDGTRQVGLGVNNGGFENFVGSLSNNNFALRTNNANRVMIDTSGNVGIGTTTPASILDIKQNSNGSAGATIRLNNQFLSANSNTELQFISGDQDSNATSKIVGVSKSTGVGGITGEMAFYTKTSGNTGVGLAERVRIDSNGNVGIGTVNPGQKLEVNGNALIDGGTLFIASSLGSFQSSIIGAQTQAATGNSFYFNNSGGGTLLTLAYSGNVGIGTTTPAARLDVQSSLAGATAVFGSVGHSGYLQFRRPSDGGANGYVGYAVSDTADAPLLIQDANGGGEVRLNAFANSGIVSAYTNNTERMRITSTGNVGIGTTSPRARLNVVQTGESYTGGQSSYDSLYPSGYNTVLESRNFPSGLIAGNLLVFSNTNSNGNDQAYVGSVSNNTDNGASSFVIGQKTSATVWTERMRIDTAGNVGIGTTGPRGTLEISSATAPQFFTNYTGGAADAKLWDIINNGATLQFRAVNDANSSANPWLTVTRSGTTITSAVFPNGNVGIGTSSPFANLSIHANNGSTNTTLFAIASSTASATTTLFSVDNTGTVLVSQSNADNKLVLQSTGVFNARMGFNINSARAGEVGADTTMTNALGWYGVGFYGGNGGNMGAILSGPTSGGNIVVPELNLGPNAFNSASNYALVYQSGFGFSVQTGTQSALAGLNASTIGIGTTSPWGQLSVNPNGITGPAFVVGSSTATNFIVTNGGNVGIGTAAPSNTLDVQGGKIALTTSTLNHGMTAWDATNVFGSLAINSAPGNGGLNIHGYSNGNTFSPLTVRGFSTGDITGANIANVAIEVGKANGTTVQAVGSTAKAFTIVNRGSGDLFTILGGGNVGIGTTTPGAKLVVSNGTSGAGINPSSNLVLESGSSQVLNMVAPSASVNSIYFGDPAGASHGGFDYYGSANTTATNRLDIRTADVTRMTILNSGNVGIGTTNPGQKLEVNGNALIDGGTLVIASSLGSYQSSIIGAQTQAATGNSFYFNNSGGNTLLTLAYNGNVGIGTTTPWGQLSVNPNGISGPAFVVGSSTATNFIVTNGGNVGIGTAVPTNKLDVIGPDNSLSTDIARFYSNNLAGFVGIGYGRITGGLGLQLEAAGANNITFVTNANQQMVINSAGNVGIGTTTPGAKLQIDQSSGSYPLLISSPDWNHGITASAATNVAMQQELHSGGGNLVRYFSSGADFSPVTFYGIHGNTAPTTAAMAFNASKRSGTGQVGLAAGEIAFKFDNWGTNLVTVLGSGNVGIGTTTPGYALGVVGQIKTALANNDPTGLTLGYLASNQPKLEFNASDNSARFKIQMNSINTASERLSFYGGPLNSVAANEAMVIGGNGNVGIGTSTPNANLTVGNVGGSYRIQLDGSTSNIFGFGNGQYSGGTPLYNTNISNVFSNSSDAGNMMTFNVAKSAGNSTVASNVLVLNGAGNVGIGTTTPGAKLEVFDGINSLQVTQAGSETTSIDATNGFAIRTGKWQGTFNSPFTIDKNGNITLNSGAIGNTYAMGSVGIGTTTPAQKLDVNGNIDVTGDIRILGGNKTIYTYGGFMQVGPASNNPLYLLTNNLQRVTVDTSGNVGIGTTNPQAPLDVFNAAGGRIRVGNASGWGELIGDGGATRLLSGNSAWALIFGINSTEKMRIDTTGNVGIGNTAPANKLTVAVAGNATLNTPAAYMSVFNSNDAVNNQYYGIAFTNSNTPEGGTQQPQSLISNYSVGGSWASNWTGALVFSTARGGTHAVPQEAMRINESGNVGIGTSSPLSRFAVSGNASIGTDYNTAAPSNGLIVEGNVGIGTNSPTNANLQVNGANQGVDGNIGNIIVKTTDAFAIDKGGSISLGGKYNAAGNDWVFAKIAGRKENSSTDHIDGYLQFSTANAAGTVSEQMRITSTGNVGIGTTVPGEKLEIKGTGTGAGRAGLSLNEFGTRQWILGAGITTNGNFSIQNGSGGTDPFTIQGSTGNFGIGTTSPWGQLSVNPNGITGPSFVVGSSTATNFIVTNGGRVGIGTASPSARLHVYQNTGADLNVNVENASASVGTYINAISNGVYAGFNDQTPTQTWFTGQFTNTNFVLRDGTNGGLTPIVVLPGTPSNTLYLHSTGNVGIGTTTPYSKLSVWGANTTAGVNMFELTNSASTTLAAMDNAGNFSVPVATATTTLGGGLNVNSGGLVYDLSTGITSPANLNLGATAFDTDAGVVQWVDMPVTSASAAGTVESYTASLNTNPMLTVYGLADGLGGMTNLGVGIGTTSPGATFAIQNAYGTRAGALFNIASSTAADGSASTNFFTVTNAGNVGIGTTSPTTMLVVSNTNTANGQISIGGFPTQGFGMELYNNGSLTGINAYNRNTTAWRSLQLDGSSIALNTNSYGNVGIGTTSPYANLSVMAGSDYGPHALSTVFAIGSSTAGTATTTLFSVSNTGNASISNNFSVGNILTVTNQANLPGVFALGVTSYGTSDLGFNTTNGHALTFGTNGTEAMRVTGSNVGIGTTSPWGQLSVNPNGITGPAFVIGSSTATNFVVTNAGQVGIGMTNPQYGKLVVQSTAGTGKVVLDNYVVVPTTENVMSIYADATNGYIQSYNNGWKNIVIAPSGGNVGIGTSSPQQKLEVLGTIRSSVNSTYYSELTYNGGMRLSMASPSTEVSDSMQFVINGGSASTAGNAFLFKTQAGNTTPTTVFSIGKSGAININTLGQGYVCSDGAGLLSFGATCATSDARLKTNIVNISSRMDVLAALEKLNGVYYNWDLSNPFNNGMSSTTQVGMIAQNVEQVFPELVYYGTDGYARLDYQKLVGFLVEVNKAQQGEITSLNQRTSWMQVASSTATSTAPVMTFDPSTGNIGIGTTTPNHTLTVAGDVGAIAFVNTSTRDAKTDISYVSASTTDDMLSQLVNLKVATYRYKIESQQDPLRLGFIAEDAQTIAPEILSPDGKGVDLYKLATFNLAATQALAAKVDAQNTRLTSLEARVTALENGSISSASGSPISLGTTSLASAMNAFGAFIQKGIAQFGTLVADRFVAATNSAGTSSAGTVTILAGNTVAQVANAYVTPSTKIFVTFTASTTGSWYIGDKQNGSFKVVLESPQAADTSFDYFLVQTQGQIATSTPDGSYIGAPGASQGTTSGATAITLLGDNPMHLPVGSTFTDPGIVVASGAPYITFINGIQQTVSSSTIDTSAPTTYLITYKATDAAGNVATAMRSVIVGNPDGTVSTGGTTATSTDTTAPVVTLNGAAAMQLNVGDTFTDPGATALDNVDGDLTAKIAETGSVNTATAGSYSLTYSATDAAGNTGSASRLVTVVAPTTTTATSTTP